MNTSGPLATQSHKADGFENIENGNGENEKQAPPISSPTSHFSRGYLLGPVKREHGDLALLACCFVTGMVDAASFSNWSCFVGMQTGNTVILGLSTAGIAGEPFAWLTTLVSIASFLVGCFATFRITKVFAPTDPYSNRLVIVFLFLIQSLLVLLSAALATPFGVIPQTPRVTNKMAVTNASIIGNIRIVSLLPPLAFQSGMQITCSRLLGFNEIPVNVLTSTYCDIMGDFKLFALSNVKRNRRVAAVTLLITGSICTGWLLRTSGGLASVLWIAGGIKFITAATVLCFMPAAELVRSISNT